MMTHKAHWWKYASGPTGFRLAADYVAAGLKLRVIYSPRMKKWLLFRGGFLETQIPPAATVADLMDNLKSSGLYA